MDVFLFVVYMTLSDQPRVVSWQFNSLTACEEIADFLTKTTPTVKAKCTVDNESKE